MPCPPSGDLPKSGIKPALQEDSLPSEPWGKPNNTEVGSLSLLQGSFPTRNHSRVTFIAGRFFTSWEDTQKTWIWSLGWEYPLEEEMATHSSILAWKIPWTEEPGSLQSIGSQRAGHDWVTEHAHTYILHIFKLIRKKTVGKLYVPSKFYLILHFSKY